MNRIVFYSVLLCCLLAACHGKDDATAQEDATTGANSDTKEKKISKRDWSITKANAYNDLFLDSATVANFIAQKHLPDSVSRRIRSFYNARNYQFAWFSSTGLTEQARGFWNIHQYHTNTAKDTVLQDKALRKKMDNLVAAEDTSFNARDKSIVNTELTLTHHFVQYIYNAYENGYVKRKEMERFIPRKKENVLYLADSLINKKHKDNKYFEDVNRPYKLLKEQLVRYTAIIKKGGWPTISTDVKSLKRGAASPVIWSIKKRLQITGDLPLSDSSHIYTDTLENAIKSFQQLTGYTPNGIINKAIITELNVPAEKRLQQIVINMERMRWMPTEPAGNLIVVNLPEFVLHVYEGNKKAFDMNVVVGKEGHNTTMFTGDLNQIVFSPYWNVPQSIVEKEVLPSMAKDPNYLERNHMEITGHEDGLPVVRQLPGPDNSLGRVKFLFPNSYDIYFHDTNAKALFNLSRRAYSHGCIRLSEPEKMAQYLLRDDPEWTPEKIEEAMNQDTEQHVRIKHPVPVFITYYTAWVDDNGQLNFREDIYNHDKDVAAKMFKEAL